MNINGSTTHRSPRTEDTRMVNSITRRASLLKLLKMPQRKFSIDHTSFSSYTPESAYWAGFLAADGCIRIQKGTIKQIRIYLKKSDSPHLEKFKRFLKSEHLVSLSNTYDRCSFEFTSAQIFDDLQKFYNLTPNKSLTYIFPRQLPALLIPHFIRGLSDGDGCICETFMNKNSITASVIYNIVGTADVVGFVYDWSSSKLGQINYKPTNHPTSAGIRVFNLGTKLALEFLNIIYENSNVEIYLDRKFEIYKRVTTGQRKTRELAPYDQRVVCKTSRRRKK